MRANIIRRAAATAALACASTLFMAGQQEAAAFDRCYTFDTSYGVQVQYGDRNTGWAGGMNLREVEWWQCHLNAMGYDDVFDDGIGYFGTETHHAVVDWQRKHPWIGRTDGVIDVNTMNSIQAGCPVTF